MAAGVIVEVVGLAVSDAVSYFVLPIACEFTGSMVVACVSLCYVTMGDPARITWLRNISGRGRWVWPRALLDFNESSFRPCIFRVPS